jgi:eukaryotic-like serine/threonine-protein kinase
MDSSSFLGRTLAWLKRLGRNPYFWSGFGGLVVIVVGLYFLFNAIIMPSYTRHDESLSVPNVLDRSYEDAREVLEARGLAVERQVGRYNPRVPQNQVVDQNPPPNAPVKPGRRVYLTVNSGTAPVVSVPDLSGTSLREARNRLTSLGLEVGRERVDSIPSPYARTVTRQRPAAGDSLKKGATVDIWYSRGLGEERVAVPDVRGVRVSVAEDLLLRRKLRSVVINANASADDTHPGDKNEAKRLWVRDQGLQPGSTVRSGTEVRLFATPDSNAVPRPRAPSSLVDSLDVGTASADTAADGMSF